jgi:iron complex outermembrane receptor protein
MRRTGLAGVSLAALMVCASQAQARDDAQPSLEDLRQLSIEDLANVQVTSVSKSAEPVSAAPAAIYVITSRDISRSGADSLANALRLAPNLQIAASDSQTYAITARGFNESTSTANKLQVLIDGRTVYTPLFSGVFWDVQNVMLEDVDRIEVISGPGGALWGANSVNGVINVTSRSAADTQGGLFAANGGNAWSGVRARYGGMAGEAAWRVYATYDQRGPSLRPSGNEARDENDLLQGGFRTDWNSGPDRFTLQGDAYSGSTEKPPAGLVGPSVSGGNLLGRWTRNTEAGATFEAQAYYDSASRTVSSRVSAKVDTLDLDLRYSLPAMGAQTFTLGGGYRVSNDEFKPGPGTAYLIPDSRRLQWGNVYLQDELALAETLRLTLGLKLEHNSYTGWEYMPTARIAWRPSDTVLLWGAVSRAVRTPSRFDHDLNSVVLGGGPDFEAERLVSYELGYRGRPVGPISLSVSLFYNDYDDLRTLEMTPVTILPFTVKNGREGHTYGLEAWADYAVTDRWRLSAGLSTLHKDLKLKPGSLDVGGATLTGNDPDYQAQLRSSLDLGARVSFDVDLRSVASLPSPAVPAYVEADARLAWRYSDRGELSISGSNLLDEAHLEFLNSSIAERLIRRSFTIGLRQVF